MKSIREKYQGPLIAGYIGNQLEIGVAGKFKSIILLKMLKKIPYRLQNHRKNFVRQKISVKKFPLQFSQQQTWRRTFIQHRSKMVPSEKNYHANVSL